MSKPDVILKAVDQIMEPLQRLVWSLRGRQKEAMTIKAHHSIYYKETEPCLYAACRFLPHV